MSAALAKALGRTPERRSRFHTLRAERVPLTEAPHFAAAALRRARVLPSPPAPWMSHRAVERLAQVLRRDDRLLELGSGMSTIWYAARVTEVVSVEDDPSWAEHVTGLLAGTTNTRLVRSRITAETVAGWLAGGWDVVVVDHNEHDMTRPEVVTALVAHAAPPRLVVLDDSDRPRYQAALDGAVAQGWAVTRFPGYKSRPLAATETALLTPPA